MVKRILDLVETVLLALLAIPVVLIVVDAILKFFDASLGNSLVRTVYRWEDRVTPGFLADILGQDQGDLQTAAFNLLFYGLLVAIVVVVFRVLRSVITGIASDRQQENEDAAS